MPTIVLRDTSNTHIGFLMAAGDAPLSEHSQRDVIFMALPTSNTSELARFIYEHKHKEFKASVSQTTNGYVYAFDVTPNNAVTLQIGKAGVGIWIVHGIGQATCTELPTQ